jgi:hypothetical protein
MKSLIRAVSYRLIVTISNCTFIFEKNFDLGNIIFRLFSMALLRELSYVYIKSIRPVFYLSSSLIWLRRDGK